MSKTPTREVITIDGKNVVLQRDTSPMVNGGVLENAEALRLFNIFDDKFQPSNKGLADGKPLRMYDAKTVKIDLVPSAAPRTWVSGIATPMPTRSSSASRARCAGKRKWACASCAPATCCSSPAGIAHRSTLCEESEAENVLVELKISEELTYVAEDK